MPTYSLKPVANPTVVFREEFDDWAVLFDPETGAAFGMSPVSALIWKTLDGHHTLSDILDEVKKKCQNMPDQAESDIKEFIQSLLDRGLAGQEVGNG